MPSLGQLETWYNSPYVRALLDTIAYCEGADYDTIFGGGRLTSYAQHPNIKVRAGGYNSEAAGRYQFMFPTWEGLRKQYGFPSFEPYYQNLGAVALLYRRGAINSILAGNVSAAVSRLLQEWPSLPGGHQQTRNWNQFSSYYNAALSVYNERAGTGDGANGGAITPDHAPPPSNVGAKAAGGLLLLLLAAALR